MRSILISSRIAAIGFFALGAVGALQAERVIPVMVTAMQAVASNAAAGLIVMAETSPAVRQRVVEYQLKLTLAAAPIMTGANPIIRPTPATDGLSPEDYTAYKAAIKAGAYGLDLETGQPISNSEEAGDLEDFKSAKLAPVHR